MSLREKFLRLISEYRTVFEKVWSTGVFKDDFGSFVRHDIADEIGEIASQYNSVYISKGSVGQTKWTPVPWMAIFDTRITRKATENEYIVYLFNSETKDLYLTFNQAAAEKNNAAVRAYLKENASKIRSKISFPPQVRLDEINSGNAAYDAGCICYIKYTADNMPSDEKLKEDLLAFLDFYKEYYDLFYANQNEWWPSREEYTPGFTKNQWLEILNDSEILGPVWGEVLAMFHTEPNGATCKMIAEKFGDSPYSISGKCTQLAKKIHAVTGCPLLKDEQNEREKQSYWPILFLGRDAKGDIPGTWIWKLRSELYEALTEFGIEKYLPKGKEGEKEMTIKDQITAIKTYIAAKGFNYDGALIENFYLGLKSKPFVILAGTSGTGKTRLVRLFAEAIGAEYKLVSVRPDWSDSSDLFGHVDLNQKFVEGSVIKFVKQAELNPSKPYFLCLDEMNLARVEYYMSDILSAIETRRHESGMIVTDPIDVNYGNDSAAAGRYGKLILPGNLYIVGTVNMDETTFPFSKKVLDRANTIEFSYVDLLSLPSFSTETAPKVTVDNDFLASKYITLNDCDAADKGYISGICTTLSRVNGILEMANAHIGYRVRDEIVFYMLNNKKADLLDEKAAFDNQIMQKILPRIQGSSESIKKMLEELLKICDSEKFEASAKKINFMIKRYDEDGFTSYWL